MMNGLRFASSGILSHWFETGQHVCRGSRKERDRVKGIRPAEHVQHRAMFSGQIFLGKFPDLGKMSIPLTRKNGIKIACVRGPGRILARGASGDSGGGCSPAKNRAVSSAVAVSEWLARAALSTAAKVIRMVATILVAATDTLFGERLFPPRRLVKAPLRQNCGGVCFLNGSKIHRCPGALRDRGCETVAVASARPSIAIIYCSACFVFLPWR